MGSNQPNNNQYYNDRYKEKTDYEQYNDCYDTYDPNTFYSPQKSSSNTGLAVAVAVLSCVLVVILVLFILFQAGVISFSSTPESEEPIVTSSVTSTTEPTTESSSTPSVASTTPQPTATPKPVAVGKTRYVDCNTSLTLRTGPSTNHSEIHDIPVGEAVYVYENTNGSFSKVNHNGTDGYVMTKYLSDLRPAVWNYTDYEVSDFLTNAVYAYVNGVNTGDTSYAYQYYSSALADSAAENCASVSSRVMSEEILSLNIYNIERVSPMRVSAMRESNIRVNYNDGKVKDVKEKYKITIDNSQGQMYIVESQKLS